MKKKNTSSIRVWIWITVITMTIYILWRIFRTIPDYRTYGILAFAFGLMLIISETVGALEALEHYINFYKRVELEKPDIPYEMYPDVEVFIATHNEDAELLYKTVNGCKFMDYPDKSKVHIYLCDDNNRPEIKELADMMNVGYFGLSGNKHAKAGNLNNAIFKTKSPYIVTFDADMIPTSRFLMETIPYMFLPVMIKEDGVWRRRTEDEIDKDFKIGFIQTPQSFYNPDLFQYYFYSETRIPNEQDFFFREVNVGRNRANAAIYAGSNTLISREALEKVGGIAIGTITEDFETGIKIQMEGYRTYATSEALAHGLAPTTIRDLIRQRARWGRGCVSSLRSMNIVFTKKLGIKTKISYIACWLYWWTFFRRFIYIISPILYSVFNIPVVICTFPELILIWLPSYLAYNHTLKLASGGIRNQRWSNIVDTIIFPYLILPILLETCMIRQTKFHVTSKKRIVESHTDILYAAPHIFLFILDIMGLIFSVSGFIRYRSIGSIIIIFWLLFNGVNLFLSILFMLGRQNYRDTDRFYVSIPVEFEIGGKTYYARTKDISETGMAVEIESPIYFPNDEFVKVSLSTERHTAEVLGKCVHVTNNKESWKYGIIIKFEAQNNKDDYFELLYDRDHSLATEIGKTVSMFDDVFLNIHKRTEEGKKSVRKLPRIIVKRKYLTDAGIQIELVDMNYEFAFIKGKNIPEKLEVILTDNIRLKCRRHEKKDELYIIENIKELIFDEEFEKITIDWQKNKGA